MRTMMIMIMVKTDHDNDKMVTLSWDAPLVLSIWWESMVCLASLCSAEVSGHRVIINL